MKGNLKLLRNLFYDVVEMVCFLVLLLVRALSEICYAYAVGSGIRPARISLKKRVGYSFIALCMSISTIYAIVAHGGIIWVGIKYAWYSFWKNDGINLGYQYGSWSDYNHYNDIKAQLIANQKFAQILSYLGGHGFGCKIIQFLLLLACIVVMTVLVLMAVSCANYFCKRTKNLILRTIRKIYSNYQKVQEQQNQAEREFKVYDINKNSNLSKDI